jgi:hypothetical protein
VTTNQIGDLSVTAQGPGWGFGFGCALRKDRHAPKAPQSNDRNIPFGGPASYPYITILRRFTFPVLCIFYLAACNAARTTSIKALGDTPAGVTSRFVF